MQPADDFTQYYDALLDGTYDCVDRIVLNAYFRKGQAPTGFRAWWRELEGSDDRLDTEHLMRFAGRFSRRVRAWATTHGVPVVECDIGDRKHELAEEYLPTDPAFVGVFLIQVARGPALVWDVRRYGQGGMEVRRKNPWPYVKHYSFHIIDPKWGHLTIRMSGHPPFGALIMLHGHEWVEREALARGLTVTKEGNCFTHATDPTALAEVADALTAPTAIGRLAEVCDRWIYSACLCFALSGEEQERSGFRYDYSAYQWEYSRNLSFKRGSILDQVYQAVIERTRTHLDLRTLVTLFGRKHRPHRRGARPAGGEDRPPAELRLEKPTHDLTVFKIHFGALTLKIYDKGERVLRIEAIVHNARRLPCRRSLTALPELVALLQGLLLRFSNVLHAADHAFLDAGVLDALPQPSELGPQRLAGLDINQPRIRNVMEAVLALAPQGPGFTVGDLAAKVRELRGAAVADYGVRQAAYDLRKLRGKSLVEPIGRSRRYLATAPGCRTIAGLLILRERVIKPVLAGAGKPRPGPQPKRQGPLDVHYQRLQVEMHAAFVTLGLAA